LLQSVSCCSNNVGRQRCLDASFARSHWSLDDALPRATPTARSVAVDRRLVLVLLLLL